MGIALICNKSASSVAVHEPSCSVNKRNIGRSIKMSSIKTAAAVLLQKRYRDRLERRAAVLVARIEQCTAELHDLPTTRLERAATDAGLQLCASCAFDTMFSMPGSPATCVPPVSSTLVTTPGTPFARSVRLPRVSGVPPCIQTTAQGSVLLLVDSEATAINITRTLAQGWCHRNRRCRAMVLSAACLTSVVPACQMLRAAQSGPRFLMQGCHRHPYRACRKLDKHSDGFSTNHSSYLS